MLLCDDARRDPATNKPVLTGIFDTVFVAALPAVQTMHLFYKFQLGSREATTVQMHLQIVRPGGVQETGPSWEVAVNELGILEGIIELSEFPIFAEGRHVLRLALGKLLLGQSEFLAKERPPAQSGVHAN